MKIIKFIIFTVIALTISLNANQMIKGSGGTLAAPAYYEWAYSFEKEHDIRVKYDAIGSGGGIKQLFNTVVDFAAIDLPLKNTSLKKHSLVQFPTVVGSVSVVHNIPNVKDYSLKISNSLIADIFLGKIIYWDDEKIQSLNKEISLPHEKIVVIYRKDASGTTYNFTYFLSKVNAIWKEKFGTKKTIDLNVGLGVRGNGAVARLVKKTPYSISYLENAYRIKSNIASVTLQTANGKWVTAEQINFNNSVKNIKWNEKENFNLVPILLDGDNSYPLIVANFMIVPIELLKNNENIRVFVNWILKYGKESIEDLGYTPLKKEDIDLIMKYISQYC